MLVASFYRFTALEDPASLVEPLERCCAMHDVRGIVLLAPEGINATIAGTREDVMTVVDHLRADPRLADLTLKEAEADRPPFRKMRVRLKREIVTMGVEGIDPAHLTGTYVDPGDWNALISDPDVIVIDTRNDYEVAIGSFQNAVDPGIESFGELPDWLDARIDMARQPRVAMFCTGGIRCEKSTALLKQRGVREVYHLEGGILKYLEQVPEEESLWTGECFVFDERVAVGHGLEPGDATLCRACRDPLRASDRRSPRYVEGVSCHRCHDRTTDAQKARFAERKRQVDLAHARGRSHLAETPAPADLGEAGPEAVTPPTRSSPCGGTTTSR
ncbi:MAG: rhodanese-related sulfurtransferase [Phycisphaerales bacterium]|nr:rhodanese-related sulfurtransferase [Phycisphaerales bacterium]